jgi:PilZ domain-containing protein
MSVDTVDLRRHPRSSTVWPVTVEADGRSFDRETVNVSPIGAKVSLQEPLTVGSTARLRFRPPHGRPLDVEAIVWRADRDGLSFFFVGSDPTEPGFQR